MPSNNEGTNNTNTDDATTNTDDETANTDDETTNTDESTVNAENRRPRSKKGNDIKIELTSSKAIDKNDMWLQLMKTVIL